MAGGLTGGSKVGLINGSDHIDSEEVIIRALKAKKMFLPAAGKA
jgi:hypothetical protein